MKVARHAPTSWPIPTPMAIRPEAPTSAGPPGRDAQRERSDRPVDQPADDVAEAHEALDPRVVDDPLALLAGLLALPPGSSHGRMARAQDVINPGRRDDRVAGRFACGECDRR